MEKKFASQADLAEKKISFVQLADGAYAYTAEGDPNTGIVIGDDAVMVIDTQATPVMAQDVIRRIRDVTDKPIKYVVMSHYHAVRVLGASAYRPEQIIASRETHALIVERGEADMKSEISRFPRLFQSVESIPGLTWPTLVFKEGKLVMATGSPGGSRIITVVVQVIVNVLDYGLNVAEAQNAPRAHDQLYPDEIDVERGISPDTIALLEEMGHTVVLSRAMGSANTIVRAGDGELTGASDLRQRGTLAVGY